MTDEYTATDEAPVEKAPVPAVEEEPLPEGLVAEEQTAEETPAEDWAAEMEALGRALVRKDAKGRALRTLVQSGIVHILFSVVLVVYPMIHLGHMTSADWKAIGMLALSTAGHGVAALVMRLLSDPKTAE
jgi:hypothetical protein